MDSITEKKLDSLYEEYKQKNSQLNGAKTKEITNTLVILTNGSEVEISYIVHQLTRFPAELSKQYFDSLTKDCGISIEKLDEILKEYLLEAGRNNKAKAFISKYAFTVTSILSNYDKASASSVQLPRLVSYIACSAVKNKESQKKFESLINHSFGRVFWLDYSNVEKESLQNIWNATNNIYPDITASKYKQLILKWGEQYGFMGDETFVNDGSEAKIASDECSSVISDCNNAVEDNGEKNLGTDSSEKIEKQINSDAFTQKIIGQLYSHIVKDIIREREMVISSLTDTISPVEKALDSIQGEITKSRELGSENVRLRTKADELENQLSEIIARIQESDQAIASLRKENDALEKKIKTLEDRNSELDNKLNDAYAINSREASLEAEKIRTDITDALGFLYEDWLEYEFSDVSDENYESLQAIIKKIFRSLERNGIDFKGKKE